MYFFYIDESGTPESTDASSRFFVVCAIVMHKSQWQEFYDRFEGLKKQFFGRTYERHLSEVKGINLVTKNKIKSRKIEILFIR
jgi:hypothetical protein